MLRHWSRPGVMSLSSCPGARAQGGLAACPRCQHRARSGRACCAPKLSVLPDSPWGPPNERGGETCGRSRDGAPAPSLYPCLPRALEATLTPLISPSSDPSAPRAHASRCHRKRWFPCPSETAPVGAHPHGPGRSCPCAEPACQESEGAPLPCLSLLAAAGKSRTRSVRLLWGRGR